MKLMKPTSSALVLAMAFLVVPFLVVAYRAIHDLNQEIIFAELEIKGLKYHKAAFELVYDLVTQDEKKAIKSRENLKNTNNELEHALQISEAWKNFQQQSAEGKEIDGLIRLMHVVDDTSRIILDKEIASYHLINININNIPRFIYNLNNFKKIDAEVIREIWSSTEHSMQLVFANNKNMQQALDSIYQRLAAETSNFINSLDRNDNSELEKTTENIMESYSIFYNSNNEQLNIYIKNRLSGLVKQRFITTTSCGLSLVAFMLIIFAMIRNIARRDAAEENMREINSRLEKNIELRTEELANKNKLLDATKSEAEHANQLKSNFLANMSHEIRTPMNGIMGMTSLLLETNLDSKQSYYARTIMHSSEVLLEIINDILDLSKIEAGKLTLEFIPVNLRQIVESTVDMLRPKAQEKSLSIDVAYEFGTPQLIIGDQVRIRQIITNLISNAIKFTEKGGVRIKVESQSCDLTDEIIHAHNIKISVKDSGIGMNEETQQRIFNKFTQADGSTTRKFGGTGLGLSICREIVHMMGGEIGVESEPNVGSTFWFTMTLSASAEDTFDYNGTVSIMPDYLHIQRLFNQPNILVVDDNRINQEFANELISKIGCNVSLASSGKEAIEKVQSEDFAIIFMDCHMPKMDGYEASHNIMNLKMEKHPPIIALIGNDGGDQARCMEAGMSDYLTKPLRKEQLIKTLLKWLPPEFIAREEIDETKLAGKNIILAEDNRTNLALATEILEKIGCKVIPAKNGNEAVERAKIHAHDIIFMDCHMPEMDGYEATAHIRNLQKSGIIAKKPIIALTAHAMKGEREKCLNAGMDDFLSKPAHKENLLSILHKWVA